MKCPYTINVEQISQDTYEYEDGQTKFHQTKLVEKREYVDCLGDECRVFVDGKCTFNQGVNT